MLRVLDAVMYAACVGACYPYLHKALGWAVELDFSYPLSNRPSDVAWIKRSFNGWKAFQDTTIQRIEAGAQFVIFADITGYYENVHLQSLASDLRSVGCPDCVVVQLSQCLNRWAVCDQRGIPQGHAPSDILGKFYLDQVDEYLKRAGIDHVRYVDDHRIFCHSEVEAKLALLELAQRLRQRGLNLQTSKTEVLLHEAALAKVKAITEKILAIRGRRFLRREMAFEMGNPYEFAECSDDDLINGSCPFSAHG